MGSLDCLLVEGRGEGSLLGLGTGVGTLGLGGGSLLVWLELDEELELWMACLQISRCLWPSIGQENMTSCCLLQTHLSLVVSGMLVPTSIGAGPSLRVIFLSLNIS
jgi:hypothetical protein